MSRVHNGVSYYIYFWSPEEKKWIICRQRFIMSEQGTFKVYGQFITSMWLNTLIDCKRSQGFVIAGFHADMLKNRFIFLDKLNEDPSSTPSMFNLDYCCKFYEYFPGSLDTMTTIYDETKKEKSSKFEFKGYNNESNKLYLRFDYYENQMLFNLPEFMIYV